MIEQSGFEFEAGPSEEFDEHSRDLAWVGGMFALASVIFSIWIIVSLIEMVVR